MAEVKKVEKTQIVAEYNLTLSEEEAQAIVALTGKCSSGGANKWGKASSAVFNAMIQSGIEYFPAYKTLSIEYGVLKFRS